MTKETEMKMEKDMKVLVGKQTDTYIDRETTIKEKIKGHPIDDTEPTKHRDKQMRLKDITCKSRQNRSSFTVLGNTERYTDGKEGRQS